MKKHNNLIQHDPIFGAYGDCHRACFAMILDLDPEAVPHFYDMADGRTAEEAYQMQLDFLSSLGLTMGNILYDGALELSQILEAVGEHIRDIPLILGGTSGKGCGHSVIVLNGEIWHDPSGTGIQGPLNEYYWFTFFSKKVVR